MKKSLSKRITVYFLIIMVVTIVISVTWNYFSTRRSIIEMEKAQAEGCSRAISSLLDQDEEDLQEELEEDWDPEDYLFVCNAVRNLCMGFNQEAIIIYTVDSRTDSPRTLLAVMKSGEIVPSDALKHFPIQEIRPKEAEAALLAGKDRLQRTVQGMGFERKALWLALLSRPGARKPVFLGMEYSIGLENGHIISDFLADILMPNIALGIAFLVMILVIRRRVASPIRFISDRMKRFAQNSSKLPEPLEIRSGDEIGEIASSFETMTREITSYIGNIEKLTKERVELNVQMDVARRIQYGLVPEKTALDGETFCACAMTRPAKAVGGDFYDCFRMDDGTVCVLMGDVSGKGISAAIFMAVIKTMIRDKLMLGLSPAQALNQANEQLLSQNPEGLFATVFAAILDSKTGALRYANAGHTWPVLLGAEARILKPETGIALGLFDDAGIRDETMTLNPGEGIFLYTDGVTDALSAEHVPFGMDRLLETLSRAPKGSNPAEDALLKVSWAVDVYRQGMEPFDDMALLVLFRTEDPSSKEPDRLPVSLSSFGAIKKAVIAQAGDTPETRRALLACDEVLSNIVDYSGAERLTFRCFRQGDTLQVIFSDDGIPFDPTAAAAEEKPFEELDSGGMGLSLIRQTASSARYERRDGMNVFTLDFPL